MTLHEELKLVRPFLALEEECALAILVTRARFEEILSGLLERHAITRPQFNILRILRGSHPTPLTFSALNERLIEKNPDITRLLDRLETMGFVERERGKEDRRQVFSAITQSGQSLLKIVDKEVLVLEKSMMAGLNEEEMRTLNELLQRVRDRIREFRD